MAALSLLMSNEFQLVISDAMMPVMDGVELVRSLRADPRLGELPVIMMSAQIEPVIPELDGMAQAFLQKPFKPQLLYATVARLLERA